MFEGEFIPNDYFEGFGLVALEPTILRKPVGSYQFVNSPGQGCFTDIRDSYYEKCLGLMRTGMTVMDYVIEVIYDSLEKGLLFE